MRRELIFIAAVWVIGAMGCNSATSPAIAANQYSGTSSNVPTTSPSPGQPSELVRKVVFGKTFTCSLGLSGQIQCWGADDYQVAYVPDQLEPAIDIAMVSLRNPALGQELAPPGPYPSGSYGSYQFIPEDIVCALFSKSWQCWGEQPKPGVTDFLSGGAQDDESFDHRPTFNSLADIKIDNPSPRLDAFFQFLRATPADITLSHPISLSVWAGEYGVTPENADCPYDEECAPPSNYTLCVKDDAGGRCWAATLTAYASLGDSSTGAADYWNAFAPVNLGAAAAKFKKLVCPPHNAAVVSGNTFDCYVTTDDLLLFKLSRDPDPAIPASPWHQKIPDTLTPLYPSEKIYDFATGLGGDVFCRINDSGAVCNWSGVQPDTNIFPVSSDFHPLSIRVAEEAMDGVPGVCVDSIEGFWKCNTLDKDTLPANASGGLPLPQSAIREIYHASVDPSDLGYSGFSSPSSCFDTLFGLICTENRTPPPSLQSPLLLSDCLDNPTDVTFNLPEFVASLFVDGSGNVSLERCDGSGKPDASFGESGTAVIAKDIAISGARLFSVGNSYYIGGGYGNAVSTEQLIVIKTDSNGTLDQSFGNAGIWIDPIGVNPPVVVVDDIKAREDGTVEVDGQYTYRSTDDFQPFSLVIPGMK